MSTANDSKSSEPDAPADRRPPSASESAWESEIPKSKLWQMVTKHNWGNDSTSPEYDSEEAAFTDFLSAWIRIQHHLRKGVFALRHLTRRMVAKIEERRAIFGRGRAPVPTHYRALTSLSRQFLEAAAQLDTDQNISTWAILKDIHTDFGHFDRFASLGVEEQELYRQRKVEEAEKAQTRRVKRFVAGLDRLLTETMAEGTTESEPSS